MKHLKNYKMFEELGFIETGLMILGGIELFKVLYRIIKYVKSTLVSENHREFIYQLRKMITNSNTFKVKVIEKDNFIHLTILSDPSYLIKINKDTKTFSASILLTTGSMDTKEFIYGQNLSDDDYEDILEIIEDYKDRDREEEDYENKIMSGR